MPSKLEQLQLQFRQKLMQEKEERMIKIHTNSQQKALNKLAKYEANYQPQMTASITKSSPNVHVNQTHHSPVKRGSPGVDRSRPLPPIHKEQKNGYNSRVSPASTPGEPTSKVILSNGVRSKSVDLEIKHSNVRTQANGKAKQRTDFYGHTDIESKNVEPEFLVKIKQAELQRIKLNGKPNLEATPKTTNGHLPTNPSKSSSEYRTPNPSNSKPQGASVTKAKPRMQTTNATKKVPMNVKKSPGSNNGASARPAPNPNQEQCKYCGRNFNNDRIEKHLSICVKTSQKKRKTFDVTKMRVKGTEAESFVKKGLPQKEPKPKKSDWKKQHEEFISTIRQAKQVQRHLAAGGKISDLPPPPPSDTSHYVPCPYCNRKFNEGVAERHIPKCKNIISNKKPIKKK